MTSLKETSEVTKVLTDNDTSDSLITETNNSPVDELDDIPPVPNPSPSTSPEIDDDQEIKLLRNAVVMAAMAPGLNAYFFANIYGQCREIVATTILVSTGLTIFTSSFWIYILS